MSLTNVPTNVLEHILSYLDEPKDLLNCRLVCTWWTESMTRVLEKKVLSLTTKWNTLEFNQLEPLIPNLLLNLNLKNSTQTQQVYCPSFLLHHNGNPFPSNSLQLSLPFNRSGLRGYFTHEGKEIQEIDQLFGKFGQDLTCLVLDGFSTTPQIFSNLLSKVPSLKTLTLAGVSFKFPDQETFDRNTCVLPALPQLTHLRVRNNGDGNMTIPLFLWLIERYSDQLVGLALDGNILSWEEDRKLESVKTDAIFGKLKQLKINPTKNSILRLINAPDLTHIMISIHGYYPKAYDTLDVFLNSLEKFSQTLVYIRMFDIFDKEDSGVTFPRLKTFSTYHPPNEEKVKEMTTRILPKFQDLENLEFFSFKEITSKCSHLWMKNEIENAKYWKVCPKLKTISVFDYEMTYKVTGSNQKGKTWIMWNRN